MATSARRSRRNHSPVSLDELDALIQKYTLPQIGPDDLTIPRMIAKTGWGDKKCRNVLAREGYTSVGKALDDRGHVVYVFRKRV